MVNGVIYLIASYDFCVKRPLCHVINEQQMQLAAYVVLRVASNKHIPQILMLRKAPGYIGAHRIKHTHTLILFASSRSGMCNGLNSLLYMAI